MDNSKNEDFLNENNDLSKVSELNNSNINLTKELEKYLKRHEEVKKNALIALYNLIGREILDEVANSPDFSDTLKMEAVSMISEYEDNDE